MVTMARRKWTLVVLVVFLCPFVCARPSQDTLSSSIPASRSIATDSPTENTDRKPIEKSTETLSLSSSTPVTNAPRDVKTKVPIGESIKMVANQLLQNLSNSTVESEIVTDTRMPPKVKTQVDHKNKHKTKHDYMEEKIENSHAGIAVPVTMEELESENKVINIASESSTSNEGISTWILLSNPTNKDNNIISSTEPTKPEVTTKKNKQNMSKNKTKRPQQNTNKLSSHKRPIIGSTNKSDLIAGGSAINENVFNKIKDTVLTNVQKNKNASISRTTTTTTTQAPETTISVTKKEVVSKYPSTVLPVVKVTSKPKKKNKIKHKLTTTLASTVTDSALLPMEPKEQEIELEISTTAATTKKPKRTSTKKRKKNKKKTTTSLAENDKSDTTLSNKTKSAKPSKKQNPITTQIYNYLSREVMPSVGVGIVGLASLVGLAGYFLYPFATPVRRTFEVDKKDDIYRHNAEEYGNEGNGQAEEEMLGTVLAGMPAHAQNKLNPYIAQTNHRYPTKKEKEQNIRYRHVASSHESPNYNVHYHQNYQQKTGIAHGAVYPEHVNYKSQYETRHAYTPENKYSYDAKNTYNYPAVEPIYAAPQTGPSAATSYGNDASSAVVYGVKPTQDTEFKPVYPYEGQVYSETTSLPTMTYPPTSMYLGSNSETGQDQESNYSESNNSEEDNKFVVGNVPKELADPVTPAIVPEHGPRNLKRKRRDTTHKKRSIVGSIEDILKAAKENHKDVFLSNEIDEALGITVPPIIASSTTTKPSVEEKVVETVTETSENQTTVYPVYAVSSNSVKDGQISYEKHINVDQIVESVSTLPLNADSGSKAETEMSNELDGTTKSFKIYEVFTTSKPSEVTNSGKEAAIVLSETTDNQKNIDTTTEIQSETTTTIPSSTKASETKEPTQATINSTKKPNPNILTYPPYKEGSGFFSFIKRLVEFKYKLGLSILQTTSDSLNRYLRSMKGAVKKIS